MLLLIILLAFANATQLSCLNPDTPTRNWPWNSFYTSCLLTLAFFFSTGKNGYMYDILNTVKQTARYSYTSDCLMATHNTSMLYAVTKHGLEIYTSRLYAMASGQCSSLFQNPEIQKKVEEQRTGFSMFFFFFAIFILLSTLVLTLCDNSGFTTQR